MLALRGGPGRRGRGGCADFGPRHEHGKVAIDAPRDRNGSSFEPKIVRKRQRRFVGFDDKILALYSRGLSTRDIEAHLEAIYGAQRSALTGQAAVGGHLPDRVPRLDGAPKIRDGGSIQRKALYLALGVTLDGDLDALGGWFQDTEGAKFGMQALNDLKQRGVRDILIVGVDGLTGFPEVIEGIFPETTVQMCRVHLIRSSLKYVPRREREQVTRDLKPIYTAKDAEQGLKPAAAQGDQNERQLPQRGRRPQARLPRPAERRPAMDEDPQLDDSAAGVQDPLRLAGSRHCKLTVTR